MMGMTVPADLGLEAYADEFGDITEALPAELSPDKKRLQEVKQLLTQLKVKLEEF